jgi:hypothetical protein
LRYARAAVIVVGIALAAAGGTIAYRAAFVEPRTAVLISDEGVREVPNTPRIVGGIALFVLGVALPVYAARRRA